MNPNVLDSDLNRLDPDLILPGSEDLPCSDDTPVDNEYQNLLPNWLLAVLEDIWCDRKDWYFGVDMGIYDRSGQANRTPTVIPDGFLSLGVERRKRGNLGRLSYVLQEENGIVPLFVLETVSKAYGEEYDTKFYKYEQLGVKYYVIYNREYSQRDRHFPFEVYRLENGQYRLQQGEPYWMPEIGLGIGRKRGEMGGIEEEWLAWHDVTGRPYPLPLEVIQLERQRANDLQQRADNLQQRADAQEQRAQQLEQALWQEQQLAEQARLEQQQQTEQLAQALDREQKLREKLRQLGVEPDQ